jgi:carboxymethylenebutenolidase
MEMEVLQPDGCLATPASGKGKGVLVLHAWWGLTEFIEDFCSRLAESGYVAFAPDLYGGKIAATISEAESLSNELDKQGAISNTRRSMDYLWNHAQVSHVGLGVIGFSMGAYFALNLSAEVSDRLKAVVLFYGTSSADFKNSNAAYLGHFAKNDPYEPAEYVDHLEEALLSAGLEVTFFRYEDAGHWFFESDQPDAYNPEASQLAWERTLSFLTKKLRA